MDLGGLCVGTALGVDGIDSLHYYVSDLGRMGGFLTDKLDFAEIGRSSEEMEARGGQQSRVYRAGNVTLTVSTPVTEACRAARWLKKHPEGVGTIAFTVRDIEHTYRLLAQRAQHVLHLCGLPQ